MPQKILFSSLALTCLTLGNIHADGNTQASTDCGLSPRPMRVVARHIDPNGIGYDQGYTTLEGFFSPLRQWWENWVPFVDLRGHVFNNGKLAANAGLGLRYLTGSRVWGANAYYDYRNTRRQHYNQIALGFESLGQMWDFRINGYLPIGDKTSHLYGKNKFNRFHGHSMYVTRKRQFAMKGANAEAGVHVDNIKHVPFYFAAGPYYLEGQGKATWGGQLRAVMDIYDYIRVEGNTSYDHAFKWIGQGQVSVIIPFGVRKHVKQGKSDSCSVAMALADRAVQRVDRFEIVAVDKKHVTRKAINPATGDPYVFWFVDNTSHSAGTYESPFNTLAAAQSASNPYDVIYVFPGDGTSTGMNSGMILNQGQQLLGAGIAQNIKAKGGTVTVPAQATGLPFISNINDPTALGVVLMAGNNVVSGLHLANELGTYVAPYYSGAVDILGGSNYSIANNTFTVIGEGECINIYGGGDNTVVENNLFVGLDSGGGYAEGIFISQVNGNPLLGGTITIKDNVFTGANATSVLGFGIDCEPCYISPTVLPPLKLVIANNLFDMANSTNTGSGAIYVVNTNGGPLTFTLSVNNNEVVLPDSSSFNGMYFDEDTGSLGPMLVNLKDNVVLPSPPAVGYDFVNNTGNSNMLQIQFAPSNVGTRTTPP